MVEHEILMIVAAPLLVLGRADSGVGMGVSRSRAGADRRPLPPPQLARSLARRHMPALGLDPARARALALACAALFEAALENEGIHDLQHTSFLGTALLFWRSVLGGASRRERGIALVSLFTTMVHTGAHGALLTLSTRVWYSDYQQTAPALGPQCARRPANRRHRDVGAGRDRLHRQRARADDPPGSAMRVAWRSAAARASREARGADL